jgi:hypothetical protein
MASMEYDAKRWANRYYAKPGKYASMDRLIRHMASVYEWPESATTDRLLTSKANAGRFMDLVRR